MTIVYMPASLFLQLQLNVSLMFLCISYSKNPSNESMSLWEA